MTDITETVKRIRERAEVSENTDRQWREYPQWAKEVAQQAHADRATLLAELERVTGERDGERSDKKAVEAELAATIRSLEAFHRDWRKAEDDWAHEKLRATSLERELAQAKAGARTPGAQEYCSHCGVCWDPQDGPWDLRLCRLNPDASPTVLARYCSISRAHSPAAQEAE